MISKKMWRTAFMPAVQSARLLSGIPASVAPIFTPAAQKTDLLRTLQLEEMHNRSTQRAVPNFFAGSILRVKYCDTLKEGVKPQNRTFTGICIAKVNRGLGSKLVAGNNLPCVLTVFAASFLLRNVIDGVGLEIRFETYDPTLKDIEVIRFARRRRAKLYYLRDRSAKESTVSDRMTPMPIPAKGIPVIITKR